MMNYHSVNRSINIRLIQWSVEAELMKNHSVGRSWN